MQSAARKAVEGAVRKSVGFSLLFCMHALRHPKPTNDNLCYKIAYGGGEVCLVARYLIAFTRTTLFILGELSFPPSLFFCHNIIYSA